MHELSIAMSIVELAEEEAERRGGLHVVAIHLRLGLLAGVMKDVLLSSFNMARQGTPLAGAELVVEDVPGKVFCPACGVPRPARLPEWFCCPDCRAPVSEIVQGRELEVVSLEVEE